MPKPHPHLLLEREGALASVVSDLHHALGHLRAAHFYNQQHDLGLTLPAESTLIDAIGDCARLHKQGKAA